MIKKLIKNAAKQLGYEIILKKKSHYKHTDQEQRDEAEAMIRMVRKNHTTMVADLGLLTLYRQALFCEKARIEGAFVECGVWKGGAVGMMAQVNLAHGKARRDIHLFDAFEEICEPDETIDGERAVEEVKKYAINGGTKGRMIALRGIYDRRGGPGTIEDNKKLLTGDIGYDPEYLHFHKGWFQDTLPKQHSTIDEIAILRIDADWYASTKICLDYLFDKVVSGGFVIIDDYGAYEGCRKAVDEFLDSIGEPLFLHYVNEDIRYIFKP